jgi:hypothetical protein
MVLSTENFTQLLIPGKFAHGIAARYRGHLQGLPITRDARPRHCLG